MKIRDKTARSQLMLTYVSITTRTDLIKLIKRKDDDTVNPELGLGMLEPAQEITIGEPSRHMKCANWESSTTPSPLIKAHNHIRVCVLNERLTDAKEQKITLCM